MKKVIIVIATISLGILFFYFLCIYGWSGFGFYKTTPKEYINKTNVNKSIYSSDSIKIATQMHMLIEKHQESFYSKEYDKSTQIIIDTILYSPDYKKIAAFIVTRNSTSKQLMPNKNYSWYYDATCYIGIKSQDSISLNWIGPNYNNSYSLEEITKNIRNYFFRERASDTSDHKVTDYNIDDIRYWKKSMDWKNLEYKKKMQKDFEEEKLKNPQNVYEPK
ncbi:hypothetical protein OZ664_09920 [Elizabethkingia sp. HX WHF]|uniref:hypothetical protein n=1 Tax=Elizabethkingia TaxID=308865 RepID=UPI00099984E4|nr:MULTISPECIES: hypothetical protein [Elizabethkingia]ATL45205.1 hypothetical protein CQS02_18790 [Elizabethkingia miricola]MCL1640009.1 hypothetical protein [Elizabethkingia bruuniana]MDX8564317.1 hypothetical protein [Elizabethkingia sp. HX WHF]OPC25045.1 hypothetical protein BAY00_17400 [Elizabethkingia bruuniana]